MIGLGVRWYLRYNLSYRDLEELLAERGIQVDHATLHRWVQRFTPLLIHAARSRRRPVERCWHVDETYLRISGVWQYLYRAIDEARAGRRRTALASVRCRAGRSFFLKAKIVTDCAPSSGSPTGPPPSQR